MLSVYNYNCLGPISVNLGTVQLHWLEMPLGKSLLWICLKECLQRGLTIGERSHEHG